MRWPRPPSAPVFVRAVWIFDRGWQRSQYISGCNNDLTSKQIVDWTCPTYAYHDCLVEIEPWDGVAESQE